MCVISELTEKYERIYPRLFIQIIGSGVGKVGERKEKGNKQKIKDYLSNLEGLL